MTSGTSFREHRQRIGERIKTLRRQQGKSLTALSTETGVSVSYLSRLEKGKSVPSFVMLDRICRALGSDVREMIEFEQNATQVEAALNVALERAGVRVEHWPEIQGLSLGTREALIAALNTHASSTEVLVGAGLNVVR